MKIKFNTDKQTFSLKGLTPMQYSLIIALLERVRLGGGAASKAAFGILSAEEKYPVQSESSQIELSVTSENDDVYLDNFCIETYVANAQ